MTTRTGQHEDTLIPFIVLGIVLLFTAPILFLVWVLTAFIWWAWVIESNVVRNIIYYCLEYVYRIGCLGLVIYLISLFVK